MLYKRRANLSSASFLHRCASHEISTISVSTLPVTCFPKSNPRPAACPRMLVRYSTSQKTSPLSIAFARRAMQNAPPPASPTSPASTCRWKRGRPVSAPFRSFKPLNGNSALGSLQPAKATVEGSVASHEQLRHISTDQRAATSNDEDAEAPTNEILQEIHLTSPSHTVHFTSANDVEIRHVTPTNDTNAAYLHAAELGTPSKDTTRKSSKQLESKGIQEALQEPSGIDVPTESDSFFGSETTSQDDNEVSQFSDSDYVPSQEEESIANEQLQDEEGEVEEEYEVEEHIDLEYQIPEDILRAAMLASPQTRASFWSAKMYRGPDDQALSTHYCRSMEVAERVAQHFLKEKVVGFDIEWRPFSSPNNIKQNASLVQLACENRIALFHISQFTGTTVEQLVPPTLRTILESPDILKVGVSVKGDFTRLQRYLNIEPRGVFELSRLHNLVIWHATDPGKVSNKLVGLAAQVLQHLQLPLYKGEQLLDDPEDTPSVRASDWSKPLDLQQIHYAAADAYAGFRLYHMLEWKRKQFRPAPPTRGLCDYDAKRDPRPKVSKKKTAKKTEVEATGATEESISSLDHEEDQESEQVLPEAEDGEEEEGYETAPEESVENQELEDPTHTSSNQGEPLQLANDGVSIAVKSPTQKRVGRVNLSWLKGPDPQYPALPQQLEDVEASTIASNGTPISPSASKQQASHSSDMNTSQPNRSEEDDEFDDSELDEALQALHLDEDGKLTDAQDPTPSVVESKSTGIPARAPDRIDVRDTLKEPNALHLSDPEPPERVEPTKSVDLSDYDAISSAPEEATTITPPPIVQSTPTSDDPAYSPEYNAATTWAQNYLESTIPPLTSTTPSRIRATIPHLRAYHMWHHQNIAIEFIANHLRDPPLVHSTVTGYILQAITLEKLDHDKEQLREIIVALPIGLRMGRWRGMAEKVGVTK